MAGVVVLCGLACLAAIWALYSKNSIDALRTSIHLQSVGVKTTGTVAEVEKHPGVRPNSGGAYTLFVEYEVDGQT